MKYFRVLLAIAVFSVLTAFFSETFFVSEKQSFPPITDEEQSKKEPVSDEKKDYSGFAVNEPLTSGLSVSAKSAILCTADGTVIFSKNADVPLPMASITKVMSVIVALENVSDLSETVRIPREAVGIEGSSVYLTENEQVTYGMLVYSAMLESANDAVTALAILTAGSEEAFVKLMNEKAAELSMKSTHFVNPHGLHENEHFTTARDYARLMSYALDNVTFRKVIATKKAVYEKSDGSMSRVLTNHNRLLNTFSGMLGGKTGYTKASGRTLVTAAERSGTTLICVTIDAPSDWKDHTEMLTLGFDTVKTVTFDKQIRAEIPVAAGTEESVFAVLSKPVSFTVSAGENITYAVKIPHMAFAPLSAGQSIATAEFYKDGVLVLTVPLVCEEFVSVPTKTKQNKGFIDRLLGVFGQ